MAALFVSIVYRMAAMALLLFTLYLTHQFFFGHPNYSAETLGKLSIYLTILTLVFELVYYLIATPVQLLGLNTLHGVMHCATLTASMLVFLLFWSIFLYDNNLVVPEGDMRKFPAWYMHLSHSAGVFMNLFDAMLWRPNSLRFVPTALLVTFLAGAYTFYIEHLIRTHRIYPYPMLQFATEYGRFGIYAACWALLFCCLIVCYLFVRRFLVTTTRPTRKQMAKKPSAASEKAHPTSVSGSKPKKQRKAD
ncbi:hypothetical protein CRM22_011275 [Opisthorchis felineus]|uniref:Uncharacterized protein n=1 Tax=Opisthorchis felineus TaxID=147828 RepID=A0A4S2JRG8_OPIFE|nr:hypothetical protein CRM22_011275 [Opisthorchis felineus]